MNNPTFFEHENEEAFWEMAKDDVLLSIKEAIESRGTCRLGLAGGSTPKHLYELLAGEKLDWEKIIIIQIDEQYVPSDNAESNLKMLRQSLLQKVAIPPENIYTFNTSLPIESAAKEMSRKLIALTNERFPLFDLLILGAGEDGHMASLFDGDAALKCNKYASPAHAANYDVEERLTLCLIAFRESKQALLLLKGEKKAGVLSALKGESETPKLAALKELQEIIKMNTV